jgi:hypothetical protein
LRRIVIIGTALAVLGGAAVAIGAAINNYSASFKYTTSKAGTAKKPVPLGYTVDYSAQGTNGNRTAPLTEIDTTVYGLKANYKGFPTCPLSKIQAAKSDTGCPKGSMAASGAITAVIGPTSDQSSSAPGTLPCNPLLHVWNGGGGQLVFFFVEQAPDHTCANGAITTGAVPPYPGKIVYSGKNLILKLPIPSYVSFPLNGVEGSLETSHLVFPKVSMVQHGKKVYDIYSTGCSGKKRPWKVTFTAHEPNQAPETDSITGSNACR